LIRPLGRVVTEAPELGAYNFTVLRLNAFGVPIDVALGNFFGGGYAPAPGQPPPPPPPPVVPYDNVVVEVKYSNAEYKPFRVQRIVDVGDDPNVGERKVLLDGVTPAWGEWKQTATGEREFEVHKTQSFPGMEEPREAPLPGGYQLLASASEPTSVLSTKDVLLILAAAVVAMLVLGAIVSIFRAKQDRRHRPPRANRHRGVASVEARVTVKVRPGSPATFETRPGDELEHDHVLAVVPVEVQRFTTVEENHP